MMLGHHDDATREFAYGPDSKVGTFSDALLAAGREVGLISMQNDGSEYSQKNNARGGRENGSFVRRG